METMEVHDTIDVGKDGQQSTNILNTSTKPKYNLEEMYKQIRELSGSDCNMDEAEIKVFLQSEMCQIACPDLFEAFKTMEIPEQVVPHDAHHQHSSSSVEKKEKDDSKQDKIDLHEPLAEENDSSQKYSSNHTDQVKPASSEIKKEKGTKKINCHKRRRRISSNSSSDSNAPHASTSAKGIHHSQKDKSDIGEIKVSQDEQKTPKDDVNLLTEKSEQKIHPYYLGQMGPVLPQKGKVFDSNNQASGESIQHKKKKTCDTKETPHSHQTSSNQNDSKIRSFSFYNSANANFEPGKKLKPREDFKFIEKNGKKFRMANVSVLCVDLVRLKTVFCDPSKGHSSKSNVIPLKRQITIPKQRREEIESQEKLKRKRSFKPVLKKLSSKNKNSKSNNYEKRAKYEADPEVSIIPNNSVQQTHINKLTKKSHNTKLESMALKKDQRQKRFEQLREKNEQKNQTSKHFGKSKNSGPNIASNATGITNNQKDSHKPKFIAKIPKLHALASTQSSLQQIKSAQPKLLAEQKPKVELKIPKFSETPYSYNKREQTTVGQGLVAQEVDKLLRSNTTVQFPSSVASDLTEYTIRKIGWWLLKEEEDPPDEMTYHPEKHDDEIYEDWYNRKDHKDDDACSIGCVSDPGGTATEIHPKKEPKFVDPDKLDEYAGSATLESKIRRISEDGQKFVFKKLIVTQPGCNYEKDNFAAKCKICKQKLEGKRAYGAHIRGKVHKYGLRKYSLSFAKYEESIVKVQPKKIFVAKLTKYSTDDSLIIPTLDVAKDPRNSKLVNQETSAGINDMAGSDGPRAVINMNHSEIILLQDIDDKLSLPSLAVFDLEPDEQQLRAKICLRTNGFWTNEMEKRWLQMRQGETRITRQYNETRDKYINSPDSHPLKEAEWIQFWERRVIEVEAEGKNPDDHDYTVEWFPFWLKRIQEIMKADFERKMLSMQKEFGLDANTLIGRCQRNNLSLDSVDIVKENKHNPGPSSDVRVNHLPNYTFNNTTPMRAQFQEPFRGRQPQGRFAPRSRMFRPFGSINNRPPFRPMGQPPSRGMHRQARPSNVPYKNKSHFRGNFRGNRGRGGRNNYGRPRSRSPPRSHYDANRNDRRQGRRSWDKSTKPHFFPNASNRSGSDWRSEKPHENGASLGAAPSSEFTMNAAANTSWFMNPNQQSRNESQEERPRDYRKDVTHRETYQTHRNSNPEGWNYRSDVPK